MRQSAESVRLAQSAWNRRSEPICLGEIARDSRFVVVPQGAFEDDYFGHSAVKKPHRFSGETAELENISLSRVR